MILVVVYMMCMFLLWLLWMHYVMINLCDAYHIWMLYGLIKVYVDLFGCIV